MRVVAVVSLLAVGLFMSAAVASAASDPYRLVLAKADFPKGRYTAVPLGGSYIKALASQGITAKAVGWSVGMGGSETASGAVTTTDADSQAKKLFKAFKTDPDYGPKPGTTVPMPAYGDEQWATYDKTNSKAQLYVRKGSVVWQIEVDLSLKTKAQTLAQLKVYAAKQKARVGSG